MRIVLLGKTGAGKSSLANVIYGEEGKFKESASANSETKECCAKDKSINGRLIRLIDTPGLFDTDLNSTELCPDILRCIEECAPGPHAFLLVLKVERFTPHEQEVVQAILKHFSDEALKYTTVVFTHGEQLDKGQKIKDWVYENEALRSLVLKCGGRCHVFDNKHWNNSQDSYRNNQVQVTELLRTIEETVREKNWKHYTNSFLEFVIHNMKMIKLSLRYTARVLLGALLGVEEFAKGLFEFKPSSEEETSVSYHAQGKEIKIILLGKTGSGKSSLGNTILGKEIFKVDNSPNSVSTECTSHSIKRNGKTIRVFDTPGVSDTDTNKSDLSEKFYNCVKDCAPGPHAFLLVLKVSDRYTKKEEEAVKETLKYLSAEALKYTTVVFTRGDQLDEGQKIEDWVYENEALRSLLQECGGRCHVFDNKYWKNSQGSYRNNQVQVTELLRTIEETVEKNGGRCYTTGFWQYLKHMKIKGVPLKYLLAALVAGVGAAAVAALVFEAGTASTVVTGLRVGAGVGVGVLYVLSPDEVGRGPQVQREQWGRRPQVQREQWGRRLQMQTFFLVTQDNTNTMSDNNTRTIVLLGKTGAGKSSLANTIFGKKDKFKAGDSPTSVTKGYVSYTTKINGNKMHLFDTPGYFDTDPNSAEDSPEMLKWVDDCSQGVHAFLLVLKVGRYTTHEQDVVKLMLKYFSEEALKYTVLVFTHGDELDKGKTITEWASESEALKGLMERCGGRCHVFDNTHWNKGLKTRNKKHTKELFKTIDMMVERNGDCYKPGVFTESSSESCPTEGWVETCYKWVLKEAIPGGVILAAFLGTVLLVKSGLGAGH
ncbi:GTPase IMAP family member 8-like [Eucyclogobius newberryi]|uniref:GTPase IMAP family member 8-like n=1 Tax=Eucyclogobius newberryi TaxID=166745 RepID=UPI003B5A80E9